MHDYKKGIQKQYKHYKKAEKKESKKCSAKFKNNTIKSSASIKEALEIATKAQKPLILLTFLWWNLLRR